MKKLTSILFLSAIVSLYSCSNEISPTNSIAGAELSFMRGEMTAPTHNSYILNGKKQHPFLFRDQLDIVKDNSIAIDAKSKLVYQTIKNHVEINGVTEADQLDVQKLILFLYGDYSKIDYTLSTIQDEQNEYFLNTLIQYKAIDFKYLAKLSKYIKSNDSYVLLKSKEYLEKYRSIISEKDLNRDSGYGAHCHNIVESCNKAIEMLQNS